MNRLRIREALAVQRAHCTGRSALYAAVLAELEDDAAHAPAWLDAAQAAWQGRRFAVAWEAAHLLLAAMHHAALAGDAEELAAIYPSCGGSDGPPRGAAKHYLGRAGAAFWTRLGGGLVQTNEVGRSAAWMVGAAAALPPRLPFHLVELGASAGLNLVGDHLNHECRFHDPEGRPVTPPEGWDRRPHPVLPRTGLDLCPRRLDENEDRLWLKACVWADDLPRLERFERAAQTYLRLAGKPGGPHVERCPFSDAAQWLAANRPARSGEGLVVFNAIATIYLGDAEYEALRHGMAHALAPWKERALWIEYERARGALHGPLELVVHRVEDGELRSRVLASGAPRPTEFLVHEAALTR